MRPSTAGPERDLAREVLEQLAKLPNAIRQAVADQVWASIPLTVRESTFSANLAAGVVLPVRPQTNGLELIESVVVSVPAGATGTVTLADLTVPVPAGVTVLAPVRVILGASDVRSLVIAGGTGAACLWLSGHQLPAFGVLAQ